MEPRSMENDILIFFLWWNCRFLFLCQFLQIIILLKNWLMITNQFNCTLFVLFVCLSLVLDFTNSNVRLTLTAGVAITVLVWAAATAIQTLKSHYLLCLCKFCFLILSTQFRICDAFRGFFFSSLHFLSLFGSKSELHQFIGREQRPLMVQSLLIRLRSQHWHVNVRAIECFTNGNKLHHYNGTITMYQFISFNLCKYQLYSDLTCTTDYCYLI